MDIFAHQVNKTLSSLALPPDLCTPSHIEEFVAHIEPTNLSAVAAVVGGLLSQDILNTLGGREIPIKNWMIFDGRSCTSTLVCDLTG